MSIQNQIAVNVSIIIVINNKYRKYLSEARQHRFQFNPPSDHRPEIESQDGEDTLSGLIHILFTPLQDMNDPKRHLH